MKPRAIPTCASEPTSSVGQSSGGSVPAAGANVVERLRRRTDDARRMGFEVRAECLDGQHATWCQIGQRRIVFIDLSQSAAEQLQQLNETLASFQQSRYVSRTDRRKAA